VSVTVTEPYRVARHEAPHVLISHVELHTRSVDWQEVVRLQRPHAQGDDLQEPATHQLTDPASVATRSRAATHRLSHSGTMLRGTSSTGVAAVGFSISCSRDSNARAMRLLLPRHKQRSTAPGSQGAARRPHQGASGRGAPSRTTSGPRDAAASAERMQHINNNKMKSSTTTDQQ
jgi:hypothetical protein